MTRPNVTSSTAMDEVLDRAARFLGDDGPRGGPGDDRPADDRRPGTGWSRDATARARVDTGRTAVDDDSTGVLVEAGWFVLQQLQIALGFTVDGDVSGDHLVGDRLVVDVLGRAAAYDGASPSAVGAAATIADRVRLGDPALLARTIVDVGRAFDDREILAGMSALIAALSVTIGDSVGLAPATVLGELRHGTARNSAPPCPATTTTARPARRAPSRPRPRLRCGAGSRRGDHHHRRRCLGVGAIPIVLQHG